MKLDVKESSANRSNKQLLPTPGEKGEQFGHHKASF